jgi:putative membrane protein
VEIIQGRLAAADPKLAGLTSAAVGAYKAAACPPPAMLVPVADVLPPSYLSAYPLVCQLTATLAYGLGLPPNMDPANPDGGLKAQTALAASKLALIFQSIDGLMIPGINKLKLGLSNSSCNLANPQNPANPCGIKEAAGLVSGGIDQLVNSIANQLSGVLAQASSGAKQVADGAGQVAGGAGQVSSGAKQLAAGASQLNGGLSKLQDGAGQLDSGAGQLADGANQLSSGLKEASSGSTQLSDGLKEAAGKAPQIPNGATQLSQQGTSQLVKAGKGTAADFGEKYALIAAGAQRAKSEGMAYGAPANAAGATAYSLELAAADGEATRNWGRGVGALAIFAIAALGGAFLRRRFA